LAIVVAALAFGGFSLHRIVQSSFDSAARVRAARILVDQLLSEQLDEETGVRGYAASHQRTLLAPFYDGRAGLRGSFARAGWALESLHMRSTLATLQDADRTNRRWLREIAYPTIALRRPPVTLELRGKRFVDRFRLDVRVLAKALARRADQAGDRAQQAILWVIVFAIASVATVILAAMLFTIQQYRLGERLERQRAEAEQQRRRAAEIRAAYEAEKRIADTLREAFAQNVLPQLPKLRLSATYLPASEAAKVGGDWYDALELSGERMLVAIGDVAGHGIEAAVAMNRTRQLLISCALVDPNPGPVLERVNSALLRDTPPMITAVAALVDARNCVFSYAAAGHPPPVLLEPARRPRLLDVGSLPLGVARHAAYRTQRVQSVPGGLLVLYTDGAIEHSRDVLAGEATLLDAVELAAKPTEADPAARICAHIFADRKVADDVAILTIRFGEVLAPISVGRAG
jgi:serine phosphatase RsbU (regulator of sigma subunit)/CHASE3 domain sensor protein